MPKLMMYASAYAPLAPGSIIVTEHIFTGLNIAEYLGNPTEPLEVFVTVSEGIKVQSNSAGQAAISTRGLPEGSTVTINNMGYIIGAGGRGGTPNEYAEPGPWLPEQGQPGGDAIYATVPISIASAFGYIWAGGSGSPGEWSDKTRFHPGAGGAGRSTEAGGGEAGEAINTNYSDSQRATATAKPFIGPTSQTQGAYGTDVMRYRGGHYGERGSYEGNDRGSPLGVNEMPSSDNSGGPGYAVNLAEGTNATLTWLDNTPNLTTQPLHLRGAVGVRRELHMDWRAGLKPWTMIYITADVLDFNLAAHLNFPTEPQKVFIYVAPGVTVTASDPRIPALSTKDMPQGSLLYLKSRGRIVGRGGDGGTLRHLNPDMSIINPERGQDGGDGLYLTIPTVIALHDIKTTQRFYDDRAMITGGGGGTGVVRLYPYEDQCVGGAGGMGFGKGGRGTLMNGADAPADPTASRAYNSDRKTYPSIDAIDGMTRNYSAWTENTTFRGTTQVGGDYGSMSYKTTIVDDIGNTLEELEPGWGGYALNSTSLVTLVTQSGPFPQSQYSIGYPYYDVAVNFFQGEVTHSSPRGLMVGTGKVKPTRGVEPRLKLRRLFVLENGTKNFDLHEAYGFTNDPIDALIFVPENFVISSTSPDKPAITTGRGINRASTVKIYVAGIVIGAGGRGGGYEEGANMNVPIDPFSPMINGGNGGNAIEYAYNSTLTQVVRCDYVYNGNTRRRIYPLISGGGGGAPALVTAEYYGKEGNYQYNPDTVRIGYGGGGGALGGKGGRGTIANGGDGGFDAAYTSGVPWNDQRGTGHVLTLLNGSNPTRDVAVAFGGYVGQGAVAIPNMTPGKLANQQSETTKGWGQVKFYNVLTVGVGGTYGKGSVSFS